MTRKWIAVWTSSIFFYFLMYLFHWPLFPDMLGVEPRFIDISGLFSQVACVEDKVHSGSSYMHATEVCTYVYTKSLYIAISFVGGTAAVAVFLGCIQGILVLTALVQISALSLRDITKRGALFFVALLLSPPIMLLLERGNIDGTIFLLVLLMDRLYRERRQWALVVAVLASLIKFYSLPLVWTFLCGVKMWQKFSFLFLVGPVTVFLLQEIWWMRGRTPYPTDSAFGNPMLGKYLQPGGSNPIIDLFVGLSVCGLAIAVLKYWEIKKGAPLKLDFIANAENSRIQLLTLLVIVHLTCYFLTTNYDYRLIFLVAQAPLILELMEFTRKHKYIYCINTLVIFWFSFNVGLLQPLGDLAIGFHTVLLVKVLIVNRRKIIEVFVSAK